MLPYRWLFLFSQFLIGIEMKKPKLLHCQFPGVQNERYTESLDFYLCVPHQAIPDLVTVIMSNVEDAFQNHGWIPGEHYQPADIVNMTGSIVHKLITDNHVLNLGYQICDIPEEDIREWKAARKKYLADKEAAE